MSYIITEQKDLTTNNEQRWNKKVSNCVHERNIDALSISYTVKKKYRKNFQFYIQIPTTNGKLIWKSLN